MGSREMSWTFKITLVYFDRLPTLPWIEIPHWPALPLQVIVDGLDTVTVVDERLQVKLVIGIGYSTRPTVLEKPLTGLIEIVYDAVALPITVEDGGLAEMVKLWTLRVTVPWWDNEPLVAVMVIV